MMVSRVEKVETTSSNSIASVRGQAHLRPTTLGISDSRSTRRNDTAALVQNVL